MEVDKIQLQLDKHFKRCYTEFPYYAKHNLKVRNKDGQLLPFNLNEVQQALEEIQFDIENSGRLIRIYILKARQEGVSTWSTGRFFWKVTNNKNISAVIVTHEPAATRNLFDMQKRYYKHLDSEFKPTSKYNNVKVLQFNNDDETGLDSSIGVATAGVKDFGSSQTINYLHLSELSKWPRENESDLIISLFQCVPRIKNSAVIIESTAKGIGGEFYKGFNACRYQYELYCKDKKVLWKMNINKNANEAGSYSGIFIPWFVFKKYRELVPDDFTRTTEEKLLAEKFSLDNEQLMWYRSILADECRGSTNKRDQEYPMTAKSAFIGSGSPAFHTERVMELMDKCTDPIAIYTYNQTLSKLAETTNNGNSDNTVQVWEQPKTGAPYLISADVAEGLDHGDFNSATVWNHSTGKQVAGYHGHLSPFKFAHLLNFLGRMYNSAWIVPERNNHGISVVEKLLELDYPNIYVEMVEDPPHKPRRRFGWVTTTKSRVLMLDHLIDDVYEGIAGIADKATYLEMLNFRTQADGKIEADSGEYDDRVMDAAIGRYTLKTLSYLVSFSHYINNTNAGARVGGMGIGNIQHKPPVSAWN